MSEKVYVNICDTKKCPGPVYAVKTGDTLYSIAQRHHCRVSPFACGKAEVTLNL